MGWASRFSAGLLLWAAVVVPAAGEAVSLDGTWAFMMDPGNVGEADGWFARDAAFPEQIVVPGAWDAQGFGEATDKLHHNFVGKGWYKRQAAIPAAWQGRRVFLCVGGVHRYAKVWVNGSLLGEHIGYLSPFEYEITDLVEPGSEATVAACVDSEQRWDVDTLTGCFDIIDYMDTCWGGIWGHVTIESRSHTYLEDLFVQPEVAPPACRVSATLVGDEGACDGVGLEVLDGSGATVAGEVRPFGEARIEGGRVAVAVDLPGASLWSPNEPVLYTARLSLVQEGEAVHCLETRFGLREIAIRGTHIYLNGKRIFLHGYGDDCIYPKTMAAPSDKGVYLERLRIAKEYGFNHVRHHSHMLPPEYYEACDEMGMLVSAEFPIAYQRFYKRAQGPALELYKQEWTAVIKRFRNHPSILDWCMGNEMWDGVPLAPELYRMAKDLDPTRPVVDSDGLWAAGFVGGSRDRDTLDFYFAMFAVGYTPLDRPDKFRCPGPLKPVVSHETGNYVTFPRLDLIARFEDNFKPFWLTRVREKLEGMGLLEEAVRWAENSERLYFACHKSNLEGLRKQPNISGHHWWLLQDYWTTSNGLVDAYFRAKPGVDPARVRAFNADVVLLEDGLDLTYRGGQGVDVALLVSNFGPKALEGATLEWKAYLAGEAVGEQVVQPAAVAQGEVVQVARVDLALPNTTGPSLLRLEAVLSTQDQRFRNEWATWVYPQEVAPPRSDVPLYASHDLLPLVAGCGAQALSDQGPARAVYVSSYVNDGLLDALVSGACVVLHQPSGLFPMASTRWKTAWWHGNAKDNNAGTVVYDHPVTRAMAPDGWCDTGWYRLIEGCYGYLLDDLPAVPEVLIRGIEVQSVCRNKALLFQARVGTGCLVVCGLNLDGPRGPEAEWLTTRLIEYAAGSPEPGAAFPESYLRERVAESPPLVGPFFEGFARLLRNEGEESRWFSYREQDAAGYVCRQTAQGHLVEWETARLPEAFDSDAVTFVFAGGVGWISQPETSGFMFMINGEDVLDFDLRSGSATWRNEERAVALSLFAKRVTNEDTVGLFYLRIPAALFEAGAPCRLAVRSKGEGSRRWFALHPYDDVLGPSDGHHRR